MVYVIIVVVVIIVAVRVEVSISRWSDKSESLEGTLKHNLNYHEEKRIKFLFIGKS